MEKYPTRRSSNSIWLGFLLLLIGSALFLHQLNLPLPYWLFSWKTLLITIGLFMGLRNGFQNVGWVIPVIIGGIFLIEDIVPWLQWRQFAWPLVLIVIGCIIIFRPRRGNWNRSQITSSSMPASETKFSGEDYVDHVAVFGGVKKTIYSKDFKGGDIVCVFGGTELNMIQADINGRVILDVSAVFGGIKLIVPANWEIKSEVIAIFGGMDDKRPPHPNTDPGKLLVIKGNSFFGGIDVTSY